MSGTVSNPQFIEVFSQLIKAQVDGLTDEQKKSLFESMLSDLTPATSPASHNTPTTISSPSPVPAVVANADARRNLAQGKAIKARNNRATKKKRVNAFMAFRAYYSPLLVGLTQKVRSGMLSRMWRAEQRQGLFHLLGDAFSTIRDSNNADGINLEKFMSIASKAVSIIPVDEYFKKSGWAIVDNELQSALADVGGVIAQYPLISNASPDDIVEYCFNRGLLTRNPSQSRPTTQATMSFTVQPQAQNFNVHAPRTSIEIPDLDHLDISHNTYQQLDDVQLQLFDNAALEFGYRPSLDFIAADQQQAYDQSPAAVHWSPEVQPPILGFDPNLVQDDFDPFTFEIEKYLNDL